MNIVFGNTQTEQNGFKIEDAPINVLLKRTNSNQFRFVKINNNEVICFTKSVVPSVIFYRLNNFDKELRFVPSNDSVTVS